jgi:hypothetical protein
MLGAPFRVGRKVYVHDTTQVIVGRCRPDVAFMAASRMVIYALIALTMTRGVEPYRVALAV